MPREHDFPSGTTHGSMVGSQPLWQAVYDAGGEIVLSGHEHNYERFAPQTPTGAADPVNGIREIIVGTGGEGQDLPNTPLIPNSEVNISGAVGVLKRTPGGGTHPRAVKPGPGQNGAGPRGGPLHL